MTQEEIKEAAKEKAKELIKEYYNFVSGWTSTNRTDEYPSAQYEGELMKIGRAVQCAEIAVKLMLNRTLWVDMEEYKRHPGSWNIEDIEEFWMNVLSELNK